ncbi:MAG: diaminopimelate decarboxylase [Coxiellaceae bacterium]|nr:MAG: diaminopimelate decarboxylase [Coxiellaceae bacterium]
MDHFNYRDNELYAERVKVKDIADRWGTPCYVYSRATLERHWHVVDQALQQRPHLICYAVKANSNIAVLNLLARLGSGFDVVSGGELDRVVAAGGDPAKVVFSGVGKSAAEMRHALELGIYCFNVESVAELEKLNQVAGEVGKSAPVSIRVNPDIDAKTHPYISTGLKENKFGIDINEALSIYEMASQLPNVQIKGVDCHIGSQLTELDPFIAAVQRIYALATELRQRGIAISHINLGGGLGVRYQDESPPEPADYAAALVKYLPDPELKLLLEPGRVIVANAGILVTRVEYLKHHEHKNFAIVDAAMNDLLRPALYEAWHAIVPVNVHSEQTAVVYDVVGPVCETGDFLGKQRSLALQPNDLLAIRTAGAYGFSMSSNYNTRPRAAEIMVDNDNAYLIRRRESVAELYSSEQLLP